jgi:hypothetical protein
MGSLLDKFNSLNKYKTILSILSFLLIGCSSTYKVSDFSSKDEFNADFNKSVYEKPVKIYLINDSSISASNGAEVLNDSLLFSLQTQKGKVILLKNSIKNIRFYFNKTNSSYSANIILNSGEILNEDNIELLPDSSISYGVDKYESLPLNKVKNISYQNKSLGALLGFIYGIPAGYLTGNLLYRLFSNPIGRGGAGSNAQYNLFLTGLVSVSVIGLIIGLVNGYTYIYQFNP